MTSPGLAQQLRERGLRMTLPRRLILDAVRTLGHATPEQVAAAVPEVDVTTVYRTLEVLESIGLIKHTHLGHGAPSYRPAEDDHVHVVCHRCGSVSDALPAIADELVRRLHDEQGFVVDLAHFTVFGQCGECAAKGEIGD